MATVKALESVHTKQFTAPWTGPFLLFTANEMPDPKIMYYVEIINHAHSILCPVPLIQLFQAGAGKLLTVRGTELDLTRAD